MKISKILIISLSVILVFLRVTFGQSQLDFDRISKSGLEVSNYKSLGLLIESLPEYAKKMGLMKENIQTRCELQLRQAGIRPTPEKDEYLYVNIALTDESYNISLSLERPVYFKANGMVHITTGSTWVYGAIGSYGNRAEYLLKSIEKVIAVFINEYLKNNQK